MTLWQSLEYRAIVKFNGEFWESANTASNATRSEGLTLEKLREAMRLIGEIPPPSKVDLFCHDLAPDEVYEIKDTDLFPPDVKGRRVMIVPRQRLDFIAHAMRKAGVDVRVEPRITPRRVSIE
jgi:hypothetical protein